MTESGNTYRRTMESATSESERRLAEALDQSFTRQELENLLATTGTMTTPEIQKLACAVGTVLQSYVDENTHRILHG